MAVTLRKVHFSNRYSYTDFLSIQKLFSNSGGGSFSFTSLKNQTSESAVTLDLRFLVIIWEDEKVQLKYFADVIPKGSTFFSVI